jgi:endonuclease/exonuclease/phosphatase family metal-dependent hydrolase
VVAFRLMTWNVQNLLPVGDKDGPPTQAALDAKLASLAQVIDAQQPDVLALQEVGPPPDPAAAAGAAHPQAPQRRGLGPP